MDEISAVLARSSRPRFVHSVLWEIAQTRGAWAKTPTGRTISHSLDSSFKRALLRLIEKDEVRRETRRFCTVPEVTSLYPDVSREEKIRNLRRIALRTLPAFLADNPRTRFGADAQEIHTLERRAKARPRLRRELTNVWIDCERLLRGALSGSPNFDLLLAITARGRVLFSSSPLHVTTSSTFSDLAKRFDETSPLSPAETVLRDRVRAICNLAFPLDEQLHVALKTQLYNAFSSEGLGSSRLTSTFVEYLTQRRIKGLRRIFPKPRMVWDVPILSPPDPVVHRILERDVFREWEFLSLA